MRSTATETHTVGRKPYEDSRETRDANCYPLRVKLLLTAGATGRAALRRQLQREMSVNTYLRRQGIACCRRGPSAGSDTIRPLSRLSGSRTRVLQSDSRTADSRPSQDKQNTAVVGCRAQACRACACACSATARVEQQTSHRAVCGNSPHLGLAAPLPDCMSGFMCRCRPCACLPAAAKPAKTARFKLQTP